MHDPSLHGDTLLSILIVEDNRVAALVLSRIVQRIGFRDIRTRESAESALLEIESTAFDVILVDWILPGMSGPDFIRRVRESKANKATPILMVTSRNELEDVLMAVESGADGFVLKPYDEFTLRKQFQNLMNRGRLQRG